SFVLQPDSFVIITTASQQAALSQFGTTLSIPSFPALVNTGTKLSILSDQNKTIHAVAYTDDWYADATKAKGGYSLEMIDVTNPCTGAQNWTASKNGRGGTPGKVNSVAGSNRDETPPAMVNAVVINPTTLRIYFSETLDSSKAVAFANYRLQPDLEITGVKALNPLLDAVELQLAAPIDSNTVYTLTVVQVADCSGNILGIRNRLPVGQPKAIEPGDIVINEILFNPKPAGSDYIELYNRSQKVLDIGQLQTANRNSSGQLTNIRKTSLFPFYLFPGDYLLLTEDAMILPKQYFVPNLDAVLQVSSLPPMPDDAGTIVLLNNGQTIIDEVRYSKDWHHPAIRDAEGVALERIDVNGPSGQKENWHSAASDVGYGTPTYKNSQFVPAVSKATINVLPKTFSPDGDGYNDVTSIEYNTTELGFVANVYIYEAGGRQVSHMVKKGLMATQGVWQWNGLDEKAQPLPVGTYVIAAELYNSKGVKVYFKTTVVLARRF
ncbi:MAG: lamin tail domain-containing protein, partial [Chitinophagaceae bacterium]